MLACSFVPPRPLIRTAWRVQSEGNRGGHGRCRCGCQEKDRKGVEHEIEAEGKGRAKPVQEALHSSIKMKSPLPPTCGGISRDCAPTNAPWAGPGTVAGLNLRIYHSEGRGLLIEIRGGVLQFHQALVFVLLYNSNNSIFWAHKSSLVHRLQTLLDWW